MHSPIDEWMKSPKRAQTRMRVNIDPGRSRSTVFVCSTVEKLREKTDSEPTPKEDVDRDNDLNPTPILRTMEKY